MDDSVVLRALDPHTMTAEEWRAFHAFRRVRAAEDYPGHPVAPDDAAERDLREGNALWQWHSTLALQGTHVVGRLQIWWRRQGSPDFERHSGYAMAAGGVLREWRRRGLGTRLAAELLRAMDAGALRVVSLRVPDPDLAAGFLAHLGARETYRHVDNRLQLADARWADIDRWAIAPAGMHWEVHAGRVPMERLVALAPAIDAMLADVPRGSTDQPRLAFEPESYRDVYQRMDERGGMHLFALLIAGEEVAAVSEALWFGNAPASVHQNFTGVTRAFRGRGLALAAKARMLQLVREQLPQAQEVLTNNAVDNAAMLHVNDRVGFRVARQSAVFQLGRDTLAQRLATLQVPRG